MEGRLRSSWYSGFGFMIVDLRFVVDDGYLSNQQSKIINPATAGA
jgi:hypothetical protein